MDGVGGGWMLMRPLLHAIALPRGSERGRACALPGSDVDVDVDIGIGERGARITYLPGFELQETVQRDFAKRIRRVHE